MKKQYIVIGASAAGIATAQKIRSLDGDASIICIDKQQSRPYNTCLLADYTAGTTGTEKLFLKPENFFVESQITLRTGTTATEINRAEKTITLNSGEILSYDRVCIATGTSPIIFPMTEKSPNVFLFHSLTDAEQLTAYCRENHVKTALVIGAGLSGIECADALMQNKIVVTLIEANTHILPTLVTRTGAAHITASIERQGCSTYTKSRVKKILLDWETKKATGAQLSDGTILKADIIITTLGGRPAIELAQNAGLALENGGIQVNHLLQTSDPNIFAAGDAAAVPAHPAFSDALHIRSTTWPDAVQQGLIAGTNMVSEENTRIYPGLLPVMSSRFFGTQFVSCGPVAHLPTECITYEKITPDRSLLLICNKEQKLVGFLVVGTLAHIGQLRAAVARTSPLTPEERALFLEDVT